MSFPGNSLLRTMFNVCVCVRAAVRARVCVCVCVRGLQFGYVYSFLRTRLNDTGSQTDLSCLPLSEYTWIHRCKYSIACQSEPPLCSIIIVFLCSATNRMLSVCIEISIQCEHRVAYVLIGKPVIARLVLSTTWWNMFTLRQCTSSAAYFKV